MITPRLQRLQVAAGIAILVVLHFYVRPRFWDARTGPDFLFIALMFYAMRSGPGAGALAGFLVGLVADALTPARFGAAALAHTVVGYVAAWGRAVFFAENYLVHGAFVALGIWVRDLLVLLASGFGEEDIFVELAMRSPVQALVSGAFAVLILVIFRQWFAIRLDV